MASESTNDPILDLLFEELDSEERDALRSEIDGDPAQAAELEGFESFLSRVRDADLVEEVPESVHASIMEAARAGVSRADGPRAARRGPGETGSIWSKMMNGNTGQIALVATVLLAGAFVFKFVDSGAPAPVGDAAEAPLSEMAPDREASEPEAIAEVELAADSLEDSLAEDRGFGPQDNEEEVWDPTEGQPLELAAKPEEEIMPGARDKAAEAPRTATKSRSNRTSRRSSSGKGDLDTRSNFGFEVPQSKKSNKSAGELESLLNSSGDIFGGEGAKPAPSSGSGVTSTTEKSEKKKDDAKVEYIAPELDEDAPSQEPTPQAAAEPSEMERQDAYEPPAGTPASIQQTYDDRDYNRTISEANEYLGESAGNATDKATVMQLKAQSLANLGRLDEADRIYDAIQRAYPSFRPDQITQARAELARRQQNNKAPKRKAKPSPSKKQQYDFADEAPSTDSLQ